MELLKKPMDTPGKKLIEPKIFLCSDWHFNHNKDFIWKERGFTSIEEMNEEIIQRHNSVVSSNDLVYCLGDCCLGGANSLEDNKKLIERLNGQIYIIRGNHCSNNRINMYKECHNVFDCGNYARMIKYKKFNFYLSHYPTLTSNLDADKPLNQRVINLCGHTHTKDKFLDWDKGLIYHCELDAHNCYPVLLDTIIEEIKEKIKEDMNLSYREIF